MVIAMTALPLQAGLVARWAFNETGGVTAFDYAGNHHGTLVNFPSDDSQWVLGPDYRALFFDGVDDYVEAAGYPGITGGVARSVTARVQTETTGVIIFWGSLENSASFSLEINDDPAMGVVGALRVSANGGWVTGTTDLRDGQWHHVAATVQGGGGTVNIRLYVDGLWEKLSSLRSDLVNTAGADNVQIGTNLERDRPFSGLIDELRLYDERLDHDDVQILSGLPEPLPGADVTINVADNQDGTRTVSLHFTGDPPRSVGLIVDAASGSSDDRIVGIVASPGSIFNLFPDFAYTAENAAPGSYIIGDGHPAADPAGPGVAILPAAVVSLSAREEDPSDAVSGIEIAVIDLGEEGGDVCLSTDPLRGGIVDINGATKTITNDGACFPIVSPPRCACRGDAADLVGIPGPDGQVTFGDHARIFDDVGFSGPTFTSNHYLLCFDVADSNGQGVVVGDGVVDMGDLNFWTRVFGTYAPTFDGPCMPFRFSPTGHPEMRIEADGNEWNGQSEVSPGDLVGVSWHAQVGRIYGGFSSFNLHVSHGTYNNDFVFTSDSTFDNMAFQGSDGLGFDVGGVANFFNWPGPLELFSFSFTVPQDISEPEIVIEPTLGAWLGTLYDQLPRVILPVASGCSCRGDLSTDGVNPGTNGQVDFGDINYFLSRFADSASTFVMSPVPGDLLCADLSTDGVTPGPNGQIDFGDFSYILNVFGSYSPTFSGPCLP
jgi:hypothetical protein